MANQPAIDPMHQFMIHKIVDLPAFHVGGLAVDMSITNSVASMIAGARDPRAVLRADRPARDRAEPRPGGGRERSTTSSTGCWWRRSSATHGRPYVPYLFTLFMVILVLNLMGVVLAIGNVGGPALTFTVTSQLAVTATLAVLTFFSVFILGFIKHGPKFLSLFCPSGMRVIGAILMVPIEMISYFVRPMTLAMRLFGNMLGGHVVMSLFGSFVVALGILGAVRRPRHAWPSCPACCPSRMIVGADRPGAGRRGPAGLRLRGPGHRLPQRGRELRSRPLTQPRLLREGLSDMDARRLPPASSSAPASPPWA